MPTATSIVVIEAQERPTRDLELERATHLLRDKATDCGILVTRHSFRTFTARLSPEVAYGLFQELDLL